MSHNKWNGNRNKWENFVNIPFMLEIPHDGNKELGSGKDVYHEVKDRIECSLWFAFYVCSCHFWNIKFSNNKRNCLAPFVINRALFLLHSFNIYIQFFFRRGREWKSECFRNFYCHPKKKYTLDIAQHKFCLIADLLFT